MNSRYDFSVIRTLRQRLNLTLKKLAAEAGLTYTTVENIETNKTAPSLKTLDALAAGLQVSTSNLISLAEERLVQKRKAKVIGCGGGKNSMEGLDKCRIASYGKAKIIRVSAQSGEKVHVMNIHEDCHEVCYVLSGCVDLEVASTVHRLEENDTILFDGVLNHEYKQVRTGEYITVHIPKDTQVIKALLSNYG